MIIKIISTISLGIILQWLSLFFSYRKVHYAVTEIIATGGFPFKIFEYPMPPMGGDWPPTNTWPIFFLNLAIWIIVGLISSRLLEKQLKKKSVIITLGITAFLLTLFGILYIMFMFD